MGTQLQTQVATAQQLSFAPILTDLLQRQCACGQHTGSGECEECRKKRLGTMQRAAVHAAPVNVVPAIVHDVLSSSGQTLDAEIRAFIEPRFGHDFSGVRVHTDAKAAESAQAVNALAYTVGKNIVFGDGGYKPWTSEGKRLLAHELTHVVQQGGQPTLTQSKFQINELGDSFEREADRIAAAITIATSAFHQEVTDAGEPDRIKPEREPTTLLTNKEVATSSESIQAITTQYPPISILRMPMLQRTAYFKRGPVFSEINLADRVIDVLSGKTDLTYSGKIFALLNGIPFEKEIEAEAALQRPYIAGETEATGETRCWIETEPTNIGSFIMNLPTDHAWSTVTTKANLANYASSQKDPEFREQLSPCMVSEAGNATLTVKGIPTDADIRASVRTHEEKHADDIEAAFNAVVVPWDNAMTAAKDAKQVFKGPAIESCEYSLFKAVGGDPFSIAGKLADLIEFAAKKLHYRPTGTGVKIVNYQSDRSCDVVTSYVKHV